MRYEIYLEKAFKLAKASEENGSFPAGAVVVKNDKIISEGDTLNYLEKDPTGHAETNAIREACKKLKSDLEGAILYASLEPCLMCFSVANWAGISKIVYGAKKTDDMVKKNYYEGYVNISNINEKNLNKIELVYYPFKEEETENLLARYEKR